MFAPKVRQGLKGDCESVSSCNSILVVHDLSAMMLLCAVNDHRTIILFLRYCKVSKSHSDGIKFSCVQILSLILLEFYLFDIYPLPFSGFPFLHISMHAFFFFLLHFNLFHIIEKFSFHLHLFWCCRKCNPKWQKELTWNLIPDLHEQFCHISFHCVLLYEIIIFVWSYILNFWWLHVDLLMWNHYQEYIVSIYVTIFVPRYEIVKKMCSACNWGTMKKILSK